MVTGPLDGPDSCGLAVLGGTGVGRSKTLPCLDGLITGCLLTKTNSPSSIILLP